MTTYDATRQVIKQMADCYRTWGVDEYILTIRPDVAIFALAAIDELEAKNIERPLLLPEGDGGLCLTWEMDTGKRYICFSPDSISECILRPGGWEEISYAEVGGGV